MGERLGFIEVYFSGFRGQTYCFLGQTSGSLGQKFLVAQGKLFLFLWVNVSRFYEANFCFHGFFGPTSGSMRKTFQVLRCKLFRFSGANILVSLRVNFSGSLGQTFLIFLRGKHFRFFGANCSVQGFVGKHFQIL